MLRAHHPTGTSRDEGPRSANGGRAVYALICERCGHALIYGDTRPDECSGCRVERVPLARVYRKPACTCGWTFYESDTSGHVSVQTEMALEAK